MSKERDQTNKERNVRKTAGVARTPYRPVSPLKIPEHVRNHFRELGFELTWVRCIDPKTRTFDSSRIAMKYEIGGGVVTPEEMKAVDTSFLLGKVKYTYSDEFGFSDEQRAPEFGIRSDDSVLCKVPVEWHEARRQEREDAANLELRTLPDKIRKNGGEVQKMEFGSSKLRGKGESFFG